MEVRFEFALKKHRTEHHNSGHLAVAGAKQ